MARPQLPGPRIDPITLIDLTENDGALLRPGDSRDGERFDGIDLAGRDLTGITFRECELRAVSLDAAKLRGASLSDCVAADLNAAVFSAPRSTWRDVRIERSRLGSAEVGNARLKDVDLRSSDFGAIHGLEGLRGAVIDDSQLSLLAPLLAAHLGIRVE
ncbi:pentapeptide repeat-containing protein [Cryobacterium sp. Sr8]|uniref:pentapeptide repeat-containing protein n=1 Tax=Cryobacterium sp. Sr8 TaxID=1259203 RepID=UPI0010693E7F|nr:pentapeptide repeat-containing protein [Cryobacterium sp. Sr8]TFD80741.1 pentapeptide repeat-containing protein [Cryobacterium sp. Sr8]